MPTRRDRTSPRVIATFALGVVLLLPPAMSAFDRPVAIGGLPLFFVYLFAVWSGLICLAWLLACRLHEGAEPAREKDEPGDRRSAPDV